MLIISAGVLIFRGMNAVEFREMDLSEPYWFGEMWHDVGMDTEIDVDLSQFAGQVIDSRRMARNIANEILAQWQNRGRLEGFVLQGIDHDPFQNIWIFSYWDRDPFVMGFSFHVAVDGNTSEVIRVWIMGG